MHFGLTHFRCCSRGVWIRTLRQHLNKIIIPLLKKKLRCQGTRRHSFQLKDFFVNIILILIKHIAEAPLVEPHLLLELVLGLACGAEVVFVNILDHEPCPHNNEYIDRALLQLSPQVIITECRVLLAGLILILLPTLLHPLPLHRLLPLNHQLCLLLLYLIECLDFPLSGLCVLDFGGLGGRGPQSLTHLIFQLVFRKTP